MSLTQQRPTHRVEPIYSVHGRKKSFLAMIQQGERIRVQPSQLGKGTLNRFWFMWLRELILTKTDKKHGFAVEIFRDNLVISSTAGPNGLRGTIRQLAAEIQPLLNSPLKRRANHGGRSYGPIEWEVVRFELDPNEVIKNLALPAGAKLSYWDNRHPEDNLRQLIARLSLEYHGGALSGRETAMIVELHFALAYVAFDKERR